MSLPLFSCANSINPAATEVKASTPAESAQCSGEEVTDNTPNTEVPALVTSSHRVFARECFETLLSRTLENSAKPFVLFVSGRGRHPRKEMEQELLTKIERQYDVTAIMFTWPSWCGYSCFPEGQARASAPALLDVLKIIERQKKREGFDRNYTLLAHSMGGFVLQGLSGLAGGELSSDLFHSIVINSAAVPQKGHATWVEHIAFGENLFITSNNDDRVLSCIENDLFVLDPRRLFCRQFGLSERLGRWAVVKATKYNAARNATYVGFDGALGKRHRYYINQQAKAPAVFRFYRQVFQGQKIRLQCHKQVIPNRVYKIEN